jgi:hypothetical protein
VRPVAVVVPTVGLDRPASVEQADEPVLVEALLPELSVEALDEGVLHRLAWLDEVKVDSSTVRPAIEHPTSELRPVVRDDRRGKSARRGEALEHLDHAQPRQRVVDLDGDALAR